MHHVNRVVVTPKVAPKSIYNLNLLQFIARYCTYYFHDEVYCLIEWNIWKECVRKIHLFFYTTLLPGQHICDSRYAFLRSTVNIYIDLLNHPKKTLLNPKNVKMALALIKTKNWHLFVPLVRKCSFYMSI